MQNSMLQSVNSAMLEKKKRKQVLPPPPHPRLTSGARARALPLAYHKAPPPASMDCNCTRTHRALQRSCHCLGARLGPQIGNGHFGVDGCSRIPLLV